jgi:hypothetical protein
MNNYNNYIENMFSYMNAVIFDNVYDFLEWSGDLYHRRQQHENIFGINHDEDTQIDY